MEQANFGTIYFNEICDLPLEIQDKLVHIVQDQAFYKTGSNKKIKLDLRIISATSKNPIKAVENKLLRDDLFYRLSVVPISIPALKDRPEDVTPPARVFGYPSTGSETYKRAERESFSMTNFKKLFALI